VTKLKYSRVKVPVINIQTNEKVGEASESQMIGAHMKGNFHPILKIGDKEYSASYEGDRIDIFPSKSPY
jgi:hypothetical protein